MLLFSLKKKTYTLKDSTKHLASVINTVLKSNRGLLWRIRSCAHIVFGHWFMEKAILVGLKPFPGWRQG